jgi:hypothetical protein
VQQVLKIESDSLGCAVGRFSCSLAMLLYGVSIAAVVFGWGNEKPTFAKLGDAAKLGNSAKQGDSAKLANSWPCRIVSWFMVPRRMSGNTVPYDRSIIVYH